MTEEEFKKAFGKNIKVVRLKKNIRQEDLAKIIGIAATTLSRIENGKDFVKASTITNLCTALNVKPDELFTM